MLWLYTASLAPAKLAHRLLTILVHRPHLRRVLRAQRSELGVVTLALLTCALQVAPQVQHTLLRLRQPLRQPITELRAQLCSRSSRRHCRLV